MSGVGMIKVRRLATAAAIGAVTFGLLAACGEPVAGSAQSAGAVVVETSTVVATGATTVTTPTVTIPTPLPTGTPTTTTTTTTTTTPVVTTTTTSRPPARPAAKITAKPAFGAKGLSPAVPMTISVGHGIITEIAVTNPEGKKVKGKLGTGRTTWTAGEDLGYGRTYTATGVALGENGQRVPITGTWTTVEPADLITTDISPDTGAVVGVATPVIVRFGFEPADKAEIERHVKITTTPKVEGAWAWIQHDGDDYQSLDFRPKHYWPAGTKVHVESDIYGVKFTDSYYGGDSAVSDFTIGRNQVVIADARTHKIVVKRDGKTVATYLASYGRGDDVGDPNLVTRSGTHIVMAKFEHTKMSNPRYGYQNIDEYWAVRISNNGEFIHQNADTVADQGVRNVSHGCINLSPQSAEAYFKSAIYGDPVEITGTSVKMSASDGDIYDWAIPWAQWKTMSALS